MWYYKSVLKYLSKYVWQLPVGFKMKLKLLALNDRERASCDYFFCKSKAADIKNSPHEFGTEIPHELWGNDRKLAVLL